jgi:hypothetical protein
MCILYAGLGITKLQFFFRKLSNFFKYLVIKTLDSELDPDLDPYLNPDPYLDPDPDLDPDLQLGKMLPSTGKFLKKLINVYKDTEVTYIYDSSVNLYIELNFSYSSKINSYLYLQRVSST